MRTITTIALLCLFFNHLYSQQVDETRNFIIRNSGEICYGDIILENFAGRSPFIMLDSFQVKTSDIRFYNNNGSYYARFNGYPLNNAFGVLIKRGEVNLYSKTSITFNYVHDPFAHDPNFNSGPYNPYAGDRDILKPSRRTVYQYSIAYGPLTYLTYNNLKSDFGSEPAVLPYLRKIQAQRIAMPALITLGAAVLISGFVYSIGELIADPNAEIKGPFLTSSISGLALCGTGMMIGFPIRKNMERAIDAWNNR